MSVSDMAMAAGLGEWGPKNRAAERVLTTPVRPDALILCLSTGRDSGLMVPRPDRSTRSAMPVPTSVYRYYDKRDTLIYVGITKRGIRRNFEHNSSAQWWPFVARQEVDHYPDQPTAARMERELVTRYAPPFNKVYNRDHEGLVATYLAWRDADISKVRPDVLARDLKQVLPVTVLSMGIEGTFALRIESEHAAIAAVLDELAGTLVVSPRRVGNVVGRRNQGAFTYLLVALAKGADMPVTGTTGKARIRYTQQRPPRFRISRIELDDGARFNTPCTDGA